MPLKLAVLSNPKRKIKKHVKKHVKHMKKVVKHAKKNVKKVVAKVKKHKRHVKKIHKNSMKGVMNMKKSHRKHKKAHRHNPATKAISMLKRSNVTGAIVDTALVAGGYAGQAILEASALPMIPGYSTLTGVTKTVANAAAAVGVPMLVAFLLPFAGVKRQDAGKIAKFLGLGMLSKVVITEVKNAGLLPVGAVTNALPAPRPYGLAAAKKPVVKASIPGSAVLPAVPQTYIY